MICEALSFLPKRILYVIKKAEKNKIFFNEILLHINAPIAFVSNSNLQFYDSDGIICDDNNGITTSEDEMNEIFASACSNSILSHEDEIKKGYVMTDSGIRIGICGTVMFDNGKITGVKDISGLVIRIGGEFPGCSDRVFDKIYNEGKIVNTLIVSPPGCGKTTLLRDVARNFSDKHVHICVVDERNEIASSIHGHPRFNVGKTTDVLYGMTKADAVPYAVRNLSVRAILCDEIGDKSETEELIYAMNSGCGFVVTAHAGSVEEGLRRQAVKMLTDAGAVKQIVSLNQDFFRDNSRFDFVRL